jgi:hypothetical protein
MRVAWQTAGCCGRALRARSRRWESTPAGPPEPPGSGSNRAAAPAAQGDLASVRQLRPLARLGGDPDELLARYALTLSIAGLKDPAHPPLELLRRAAAASERSSEPRLREALAIRLILSLVSSGNRAEALAVYDRERQRFPLDGLTRAELERSQARRSSGK